MKKIFLLSMAEVQAAEQTPHIPYPTLTTATAYPDAIPRLTQAAAYLAGLSQSRDIVRYVLLIMSKPDIYLRPGSLVQEDSIFLRIPSQWARLTSRSLLNGRW
jgi:hypothetical protein